MSAAGCPAPSCAQRPRWEVADVFRRYGEACRRAHALPASHLEVMHAIEACRTAELGGHVERCDACGFERIAYNSCRNRHCPKCQALVKARWLEARERELLPVQYFHAVFTLPHALNPLALSNKTLVYGLLFRAVAETLAEFGHDPRHGLGGKPGFSAVLHTWDPQLHYHVHLHCLIPGGALSPDGQHWTPARDGFLFPVRQLSEFFRGKFLAALAKACDLARCRQLLGLAPKPPAPEEKTPRDLLSELAGTDLARCPHCLHGARHFFRVLLPLHPGRPNACPPLPCIQDSS